LITRKSPNKSNTRIVGRNDVFGKVEVVEVVVERGKVHRVFCLSLSSIKHDRPRSRKVRPEILGRQRKITMTKAEKIAERIAARINANVQKQAEALQGRFTVSTPATDAKLSSVPPVPVRRFSSVRGV
jgi:hypothetical protein